MLFGIIIGGTAGYLLGRGAKIKFTRNPYPWGAVQKKGRR